MSFTLADIRTALKAQLMGGALEREINVSLYGEPTEPPALYLWPTESGDYITYDQSFGNVAVDVEFELEIDASGSDSGSVWVRIDDFLSAGVGNPSSIVDAINADPTLGGVVESCRPVSARVDRDSQRAFLTLSVMGARS